MFNIKNIHNVYLVEINALIMKKGESIKLKINVMKYKKTLGLRN